jgi:hypothetical protein
MTLTVTERSAGRFAIPVARGGWIADSAIRPATRLRRPGGSHRVSDAIAPKQQ